MSTEKFGFLRTAQAIEAQENRLVATLEGELLKEWRESVGLTQTQLGLYHRPVLSKGRVSDAERLTSSLSVESILGFIYAMERGAADLKRKAPAFLGKPDNIKLSIFFGGEDEGEARQTAISASLALAKKLAGGGRS